MTRLESLVFKGPSTQGIFVEAKIRSQSLTLTRLTSLLQCHPSLLLLLEAAAAAEEVQRTERKALISLSATGFLITGDVSVLRQEFSAPDAPEVVNLKIATEMLVTRSSFD